MGEMVRAGEGEPADGDVKDLGGGLQMIEAGVIGWVALPARNGGLGDFELSRKFALAHFSSLHAEAQAEAEVFLAPGLEVRHD